MSPYWMGRHGPGLHDWLTRSRLKDGRVVNSLFHRLISMSSDWEKIFVHPLNWYVHELHCFLRRAPLLCLHLILGATSAFSQDDPGSKPSRAGDPADRPRVVPADQLDDNAKRAIAFARSRALTSFPPVPDGEIQRLVARETRTPPKIDGHLHEDAWLRLAERSPPFVDLISGKKTVYDTRVSLLWDKENLYVGYWIEEPNVRAKFKVRDQPIWQDNDVELFIAFDHAYYELELNAHNTLYEGLFVWQSAYERHGFSKIPELDRKRDGVQHQPFNGVGFKDHPRGMRWAFLKWDFPKLRSAVQVQGVLNDGGKRDGGKRDRGWTVELALPWDGMKSPAIGDKRSIPPNPGDQWRMDFSRFNQYHAPGPHVDSGGWALSKHGVWDSHIPEAFPYVTFQGN